jgi:hypothetical protein
MKAWRRLKKGEIRDPGGSRRGRCGKKRYRTRLDANLRLAEIHRRRGGTRSEWRAYWCAECGAYHLTSRRVGGK